MGEILRHFLPNVLGPLVVFASVNIPVVITIEAGLSFLGLGVQPPQASLGSLIKDGYICLSQSWWPKVAPSPRPSWRNCSMPCARAT
jgi:peptide/nickel transport system permease protein